jgi:hypothetical protein
MAPKYLCLDLVAKICTACNIKRLENENYSCIWVDAWCMMGRVLRLSISPFITGIRPERWFVKVNFVTPMSFDVFD